MLEKLEKFCYIKKDFVLDWYSGTGKGGQHRNKHQNCLRLTHIPSGIIVSATEYRDRPSNKRLAFQRLKPLLIKWIQSQLGLTEYPKSDKVIRTYNHADNRIVDHISGEIYHFDIDKQFDKMLKNTKYASVAGTGDARDLKS